VNAFFLHGPANARFSDSGQPLDFTRAHSYLALIPIHRLPGGAFLRASVFRLGAGLFSDEMGRLAPCGAE
jgi:hypothetical protein